MADEVHDVAVRIRADAAQYATEMAKAVRSTDTMGAAEKRAADEARKTAREQERAAEKVAKAKQREAREAERAAEKIKAAEKGAVRESETAAQKKERLAAKAIAAKEREARENEKWNQKIGAAERRSAKEAEDASRRKIAASQKSAAASERAAAKQAKAAAIVQKQQNAQIAGAGAGAMASGQSMVGTALTAGAGFGIVSAIKSAKEFNATLTDVAITAGNKSKSWTSDLESRIVRLSNKFGIAKEKVAEFVKAYVEKTGDVKTAIKLVPQMTGVGVASGADMGNLALLSADLSGTMKADPYKALNILRAQEKLGSMTLKDTSGIMGKVIGSTGGYGKVARGEAGVAALGGLMQITKRTTNQSADEIQTGISRFMEHLARDPEKVSKMLGINAGSLGRRVNGAFQFKDLETVFRTIGEGGARNVGRAQKYGTKAFGDEGVRVFQALAETSKVGWGRSAEKGGASGFFNAAPGDVLATDLKQRMDSEAHKIDAAWNKVKNSMHEAVLPALQALAKAAPAVVSAFKFIVSNARDLAAMFVILKASAWYASLAMKGAAGGGVAGAASSAAAAAAMGGRGAAGAAAGAGARGALAAAGAGIMAGLPAAAVLAGGYGAYKLYGYVGDQVGKRRARQRKYSMGWENAGAGRLADLGDFAENANTRLGLFGAGTGYYTGGSLQGVKDRQTMERTLKGWASGDTADINALLKTKGLKGADQTLWALKDIEARRRDVVASEWQKKHPGQQITEAAFGADPALAKLGKLISSLDGVLAKLLSGESIQVTALVNIPLNETGSRADYNTGPDRKIVGGGALDKVLGGPVVPGMTPMATPAQMGKFLGVE